MRKAELWGLLWTLLCISEIQAANDPAEEQYNLVEGQSLNVKCPFNIMKYANSRKAWQRLPAGKEPLTLVVTERPIEKQPSEVHMGKYTLKDDPSESVVHVQMADLRVTDSGLYRCVIYHPPKDPVLLYHPVRLVVTKGSSGTLIPDNTPTRSLTEAPTFSNTKHQPRDTTTVTQTLLTTAVVSSPDPGVTFPNVTDVTRVSTFSIVVPVVCGLFSKTLVFTVLFAVTRRSFG